MCISKVDGRKQNRMDRHMASRMSLPPPEPIADITNQ